MYDEIPYQVKQGAGDGGITTENMEKSQHTDINEDTTNGNASVVCNNVRLWKLDTQKEKRNTSWRLWNERAEKDSACFVDSKKNKWMRELLDKARKLAYYGHTMRKQGRWCKKQCQVHAGEEDYARPGWTTSICGQDSPWKSQSEWQRTEINGESTSMVWPTLGSRTAKKQNRTQWGDPVRLGR